MNSSPYQFHRRTPELPRRNEIYLAILNLGLDRIRGAAFEGDSRHCEIESNHLHNIPSYIAEGDAGHHLYYLASEVPFYLDDVGLLSLPNLSLLDWYIPLWQELEALIPIDGSPWEEKWRGMKENGWSYDIHSRAKVAAGRLRKKAQNEE